MKGLSPQEIEVLDAESLLEEEIIKTFALLEVTAILRRTVKGEDFLIVDMITLDGLDKLSKDCRSNLLDRFNNLVEVREKLTGRAKCSR